MNESAEARKAEATLKPRSRWSFLLRPWFLISLTVLALLVAIPLGYRASRFSGIPPIGEIVDREKDGRIEIAPEKNAFSFYQRAFTLIPATFATADLGEAVDLLRTDGWDAVPPATVQCLDDSAQALAEWKRGTELDRGIRFQAADLSDFEIGIDYETLLNTRTITYLALLQSGRYLHEGRPEDSWQWLRASFRFSRHLGNPGLLAERLSAVSFHTFVTQQLVVWAGHEDVTAEHLTTALANLRTLNKLTAPNSVTLKYEYLGVLRWFESSARVHELALTHRHAVKISPWLLDGYLYLNAEPQLCRVLTRHVYANLLSQCDLPRWDRTDPGTRHDLFRPTGREKPPLMAVRTLDEALMRSALARNLIDGLQTLLEWTDREQARQTSLELCLCVELFRRKHGKYPETLADLVPDFLDEIPRDLFGAVPAEKMLMIRREAVPAGALPDDSPANLPGLIIYSRGEDGLDGGGDIETSNDLGLRIPFSPDSPRN